MASSQCLGHKPAPDLVTDHRVVSNRHLTLLPRSTEIVFREVVYALDRGQDVMGKYRDHRERRGKRRGNAADDGLFEPTAEPGYFQNASPAVPEVLDAEVLWFNAAKGFGFVKLPDGAEAYLHIRVVEAAGRTDLPEGTQLKVMVEDAPRGRQVVNVLDIQDPRAPASVRRLDDRTDGTDGQLEIEGSVKWYNSEKGFGFISPDNGAKDVFVHATGLTRSGLSLLEEGQRVVFQSAQGKRGMEVRSIRLD
ncbi:Cold shock-like protein CspE [Rhizobiaceae bacterium]|nr:Cold shock-like protein CspE [Rhizobiaceae bacterium]